MSTDENKTKDQKGFIGEELSLEDLDQLIADQDPEFNETISPLVGESGLAGGDLELLDLDALLALEQEKSLKARLKRLLTKIKIFAVSVKASLKHLLFVASVEFFKKIKTQIFLLVGKLKESLRQFGFKPLKFKLYVVLFIFICVGATTGIYYLLKKGIPEQEKVFMNSMSELAESELIYQYPEETESFYENIRAAQNMMVLSKLIVNLKTDPESTHTPMLAAEVYIEGNSSDLMIELKSREVEVRDAFMRTMEEFTPSEVESSEGKQKLLEKLAQEANKIVTEGKVKRVFFKTLVFKN